MDRLIKLFHKNRVVVGAVIGLGLLVALSASAQPQSPITSVQDIINVAKKILTWVATIFWIAAVIAIFYAAFLYLTAAGDQEKTKKAHRQLWYAIIAMAVGVVAYGIPALVENILTPGGGTPPGTIRV